MGMVMMIAMGNFLCKEHVNKGFAAGQGPLMTLLTNVDGQIKATHLYQVDKWSIAGCV